MLKRPGKPTVVNVASRAGRRHSRARKREMDPGLAVVPREYLKILATGPLMQEKRTMQSEQPESPRHTSIQNPMPILELFCRGSGAGPGVVCLHANASSSSQWRRSMERLAPYRHVPAPDTYGAGRGPAWPADRVLELRDEVVLLEAVFARAGTSLALVGIGTVAHRRWGRGATAERVRRWRFASLPCSR